MSQQSAIGAVLRQWFWDDWARLTKPEREARFKGAAADLLALAPARAGALERERAIEAASEVCRQLVREREFRISTIAARYVDALLALPDPVRDEMERLRKIEEAARYVRGNWDREATQHASMPALREALDGHPGAPTRAEVLAASIVQENARLHAVRDAAREVEQLARRHEDRLGGLSALELAIDRLRAALDENSQAAVEGES